MTQNDLLLDIRELKTHFFLDEGVVKAVDGASLSIRRGMTLGVVGESGCGKSVTAFSVLQLVSPPGRITGGEILWYGRVDADTGNGKPPLALTSLKPESAEMRTIRGGEIAMIFQEPMTALSMYYTIGAQIIEAIRLHSDLDKRQARDRAIELLRRASVPKPETRVDAYPFQLSGGLRQRAMIAMALAGNPALLIADEPTTALDVTTQAQILELMKSLQAQSSMSIMLITHDLGVVAEMCSEVAVMYLGWVVEQAPVDAVFHDPLHPYTRALLHSIPRLTQSKAERLNPIEGTVPDPYNRPSGCPFHPRCAAFIPGQCDRIEPPPVYLPDGRMVRCLLYTQHQAQPPAQQPSAEERT